MGRAAAALAAGLVLAAQSAAALSTPPPQSVSSAKTMESFDSVVQTTYGRVPLVVDHGKGCLLYSDDGREFLDFAAGISTNLLGHAHPKLVEAVSRQIGRISHCSNLYYIPQQGDLARWLVDNSVADRAFFCNSGAEANEAQIKLARKHAATRLGIEEPVIITAENSFHGRTLTAITATGQPKYQKHFGPLTPGFEYVPYNDVEALRAKVAEVNAGLPKRGLAAILLEPLQGEGGIRPGALDFFAEARRLCDETGALLLLDEVQVGMGRTGRLWGYENLGGVEPDAFSLAKALGGGVPIGAMLCKASCDVFEAGDHASTFGGNPLACAAGLAVAAAVEEEGLVENARSRGDQLRRLLRELGKDFPGVITDVRGWGLIDGVELSPSSAPTAAEVAKRCLSEGLLVVPAGLHVVRFVPPLVCTSEDVERAVGSFRKALETALEAAKD